MEQLSVNSKRVLMPDLAEHVCPAINNGFPASSKVAETPGLAMSWGCFEPAVATHQIPA